MMRLCILGLTVAALAITAGCRSLDEGRGKDRPAKDEASKSTPPAEVTRTDVAYSDNDGFDQAFKVALNNQDPAIVVSTRHTELDWGPRLNAWVAAWNEAWKAGGRRGRTVRGQPGVSPVVIDGDSIEQFRGLVGDLLDRADAIAEKGSAWYRNKVERRERVRLLEPYNLRFRKGGDGTIQLVFFHEDFRDGYPRFLKQLEADGEGPREWTPGWECSMCRAGPP